MTNQFRKDEADTDSEATIREMREPPGRLGEIVRRLKRRAAEQVTETPERTRKD